MAKERVYDKINYQTNFTSTSTYAILLKAIKNYGVVDSEYARVTLFPQARSNAGMRYNPAIRDTHGEISLAQYGLIKYVDEKKFKLSPLGERFLELFNDDYSIKEGCDYNYVSTMVDALFSWVDKTYSRNINVGVLLFKLLLEKKLEFYITAEEWSFVAEFSEIETNSEYDSLVEKICEDRQNSVSYPLKKANVFLDGLVGTWKLLEKEIVDDKTIYKVTAFAKDIIIEKIRIIESIDKVGYIEENNDDDEDEVEVESEIESKGLPTCSPRTTKIHPLNAILYGAPGTGKTYATAEYAVAIIENRDIKDEDREELMKKYRELQKEGKIIFTTFHQSYGYEDFIQGLRPETKDGVMEFKPVDGVFKRIADRALKDNESNYVIIIDEINRANMSKVLGELIALIEDDKRWGEVNQLSVTLPSGEVFAVPNNLYIVGTMNTADKSISIIDVALRRRFEFIEQQVDPSKVTDAKLREVLNKINSKLKDETDSTDLLVGHAYFMNKTIDDLANLLNRSIIPLLYEYFFDNGKKVKSVIEEAIKETEYKVDSSALGRIKVVKE